MYYVLYIIYIYICYISHFTYHISHVIYYYYLVPDALQKPNILLINVHYENYCFQPWCLQHQILGGART